MATLQQLKDELDDKEAGKSDIAAIMGRRHEESLQLAGDMSVQEEADLAKNASGVGAETVVAVGEKHFTRDHALELEKNFQKLSHFFGVQTVDELVAKVLKFAASSADEKAEQLQADIDKATSQKELLEGDLVALRTQLESERFGGDSANAGYVIFSPRGETLLAYGGSDEVIEHGEAIKECQRREDVARARTSKHLVKGAATLRRPRYVVDAAS